MSITERSLRDVSAPILEAVARGIGRHGLKSGDPSGAPAVMRITTERNVKRVVQIYWTPFQVEIEGECIALYLEVAEPRVHWTECYLSSEQVNWVLCFHERPDGDIQLAYYREYRNPLEAVEGFFNLSVWYTLTATDKEWSDVVYQVDESIDWPEQYGALAGASTSAAVQEALKKSTILWLRWTHDGVERTMPVWYLLDNKTGVIYVLSGERQQMLPGAASMRECDVILRQKGKNVQIAEIPASVRVLPLGDEWDEAAEKIAEKRLNIPGLPEETAKRWRDECVILELRLRM
ncbi:MAG: hypothetical protein M3214_04085 [Actinomycetota bacterium]|nr:hypothetical protein [Actinomycetota bacterium]